jgi:hypothetical protein
MKNSKKLSPIYTTVFAAPFETVFFHPMDLPFLLKTDLHVQFQGTISH